MTENKYKGVVKEPCLLVPSRQSSVVSGQFGLDFQGPKSFELNLKLLNFSPMDRQTCGGLPKCRRLAGTSADSTVYGTSPPRRLMGANLKWRKGQCLLAETAYFKSLSVDL